MQTFITSTSYDECAQALDDKRLKNQRNEALIILKTLLGEYPPGHGWPYHPNTKRWKGHESQLIAYALAMCHEMKRRGIKSKHADSSPFLALAIKHGIAFKLGRPPFITAELIAEHKRILQEKQTRDRH